MTRRSLLVFFGFIFFTFPAFAQQQPATEPGLPFLDVYTPETYSLHPQNWAITRSAGGIMFFANTAGLLEYDGVNWRQHALFENLTITSLAYDRDGTLFLGGRGEIGYVAPDSSGSLSYHSLTSLLPDSLNLGIVWETVTTSRAVFFRSSTAFLRWDGDSLSVRLPESAFGYMTSIRDTVYIIQKNKGLYRFAGDALHLLPGGDFFADKTLYLALPLTETSGLLLGTRSRGLFFHDGRSVQRFDSPAQAFFEQNQVYSGQVLRHRPGHWALATTRGGLVILNASGQIVQQLDKSHGLPDNKIHAVYEDPNGTLWLALNNGLARAELHSPFSIYDSRLGLEGTPHALHSRNGTLFVATSTGLYRADAGPPGSAALARFSAISGIDDQVWSLHATGSELLVGTARRIYAYDGQDLKPVAELPGATYCFLSLPGSGRVAAGGRYGLIILEKKQGSWQLAGEVAGISSGIRTLAMDAEGALWLGTVFNGVMRLTLDRESPLQPLVEKFGEEHGLPRGMAFVYAIDGAVKVGTYHGLFRFDGRGRFSGRNALFTPDSSMPGFLSDSTITINDLAQAPDGTIWAMAGAGDSHLYRGTPAAAGGYNWSHRLYQRLAGVKSVTDLVLDEQGTAWLAGRDEKIYRVAAGAAAAPAALFPVHIRRVSTIPNDSLVWGGGGEPQQRVLAFAHNSLRFSFAAVSYDLPSATRYQVKLEGYDDAFSPWTPETRKDYTRLPAGEYTFTVRARDVYGRDGQPGAFAFVILAPWYQRWWAYLLYLLAGGMVLVLVTRVRLRYLEQKNRELEALIADRTQVVREQAEKLRELDTMKSRFFANISHEFRTPLTLVFAAVDDLLERSGSAGDREQLGLIQRQSRRVLKLINQLLDLSRLETGAVKLHLVRGNFDDFLRGIVMTFASLAEQKGIRLQYSSEPELAAVAAVYDPDQVEKIFYNLLSNAFKFTPETGSVNVHTAFDSRTGVAEITVRDTGAGIAPPQLGSIFQRFFTAESQGRTAEEGIGIGLALTRELVELHKGEISVRNTGDSGAEFTVRLPVTQQHFSSIELAQAQPEDRQALEVVTESAPEAARPAAELPAEADDSRPLILIVEDHPEVRRYLSTHLRQHYRVIEAADGSAGETAAIESVPDLIISDVMMPGQDGYALCAALKQNEKTSHIPIILLTARAGESDKLSGLETGADDYLTKPFNSKELHVRVRNLISQRRILQERFRQEGLMMPRDITVPSVEQTFLNKMMQILEDNLGEEEFGVAELSDALHMSRRQVHRKIKAISGETPTDFIRRVRLQRARRLLEQKAGSVSEIAFQVGFGSLSYFTTAFKKQFGVLPSEV